MFILLLWWQPKFSWRKCAKGNEGTGPWASLTSYHKASLGQNKLPRRTSPKWDHCKSRPWTHSLITPKLHSLILWANKYPWPWSTLIRIPPLEEFLTARKGKANTKPCTHTEIKLPYLTEYSEDVWLICQTSSQHHLSSGFVNRNDPCITFN